MLDRLIKKATNNHKEITLLYVTLDLHKFREEKKGSCDIKVHPCISDEVVKQKVNDLIDYIRDNFDMEDLV